MRSEEILERLLKLVARLYAETEGFEHHSEDAQLWYNRGYANGMLAGLIEHGHSDAIRAAGISPDPADLVTDQALLPWGKAHTHGYEVGYRETQEVMGTGA
ncbi:excinuclease ATPase subunit [Thiohalobacter thiocyanaticus]|uniref:Excinuclease ATPase subunit n=1 Tax=Thiohalobacter thiocyanaticus TaxID=585455 RepID=A0A1Z4VNQ1_9GAMM|nr:hypothetical protein [Thiohalobacter thiocyanaticus]BAZ93231.1 excinuclease ATPase subunit [Thiohalobacter thiocyanaticus]